VLRYLPLALIACSSSAPAPHVDAPGECLALPGAARANLVADPQGGGLYWFEPVTTYDFNHTLKRTDNLVRYDLATHHLDTIVDHVSPPVIVLGDKVVVITTIAKTASLVLVDRDHTAQALLPEYLAPVDVEPVDDHTLAVLADGDGPRAVYTLDLARPRPHHLIDAEILLSTWAGRVLTRTGDTGVALAPDGEQHALSLPIDATHPQGQDAYYVVDSTIHVRRMIGGGDRSLVGDHANWQLVSQPGSVLAFSQPAQNRSEAYLLAGNAARALPVIEGGGAILGVTRLQAQTWALIGHNTTNYNGNLVDTVAETDVCLLPATGTVAFKTRALPKRFADKAALVGPATPKGATLQILDSADLAPSMYLDVPDTGGQDLDAMWKHARDVHHSLTVLFGDRELRTEIHFSDSRSAIHRWRRDRLRERAVAGMGDALVSDPADFDLDVENLVDKRDGDRIVCSGTFVNRQARAFDHVDVRCIGGDRVNVISIPHIAPDASVAFEHSFDVKGTEQTGFFEVVSGREPLEIRDVGAEARIAKAFAVAAKIHDELQLTLSGHQVSATGIAVQFDAPADLATRSEAELTDVAKAAYAECRALRAIYALPTKSDLDISIAIERGKTYDFDGTTLTPQ
jgi:hypothetical protein